MYKVTVNDLCGKIKKLEQMETGLNNLHDEYVSGPSAVLFMEAADAISEYISLLKVIEVDVGIDMDIY